MKNTFCLILVALVLHPQSAAGDDIKCQKAYGQALRACADPLNFPSPDVRAGAQKACVEGAQLTKTYCMSGINACLDSCKIAYENSVAVGEVTFDPAICGGGVTCEEIILQQRANCISNAVSVLDSCTAACPQ